MSFEITLHLPPNRPHNSTLQTHTCLMFTNRDLIFPYSNASRTGILAATDSSLAFLPLKNFVKNARSQSIVAVFDEVPSQMRLSSIQRLQYSIQRNWLTRDAAPLIEIILFSKGLIAPSANQSYITLLGGIQVSSDHRELRYSAYRSYVF